MEMNQIGLEITRVKSNYMYWRIYHAAQARIPLKTRYKPCFQIQAAVVNDETGSYNGLMRRATQNWLAYNIVSSPVSYVGSSANMDVTISVTVNSGVSFLT
jgi:hypothetical protein